MATPIQPTTTVAALGDALRERILDGDLAPGRRLTERELVDEYRVARHTARAALRALEAESLVQIEPNRGAHVAALDAAALTGLFDIRRAIELEAAHLMLERHDGTVAPGVRSAVTRLDAVCARARPAWHTVVDAHQGVHDAIVAGSQSERLVAAGGQIAGETRVFVIALRPLWSLDRMAAHHRELVAELEAEGPAALRRHLDDGESSVRAALASGG